jgi:hypothetical protein
MAGRPRIYANNAEKARAYRQRDGARLILLQGMTLEEYHALIEGLIAAVEAARKAGDPLALSLDTLAPCTLLASLTKHFERVGREHTLAR